MSRERSWIFLSPPFPSSSARNTDPKEVKDKIFYLFALAAKKCKKMDDSMPQERSNKYFPSTLVAKMSWSKAELSPCFIELLEYLSVQFDQVLPFGFLSQSMPLGSSELVAFSLPICTVCKESEPWALPINSAAENPAANPSWCVSWGGDLLLGSAASDPSAKNPT